MESLIVHLKNQMELNALKSVMKEMGIKYEKFHTRNNKTNPFVEKKISFNTLLSSSTYVIENSNNFNFFSFDGILKSFFSFGLINLLFSYSIRYILIKILILLFPFALLSLVTTSTSWIFKSWFRTFFSLIFVQIFIIFVLILLFSLNINTSDMFSQISYVSTVFILTKSNSYIKELLGGISTDLNYNILNFKNLFK
jgi:hypothetical protein